MTWYLSGLESKKLCNTFQNAFYTKTRLFHSLLPDIELLNKMFPAVLVMSSTSRAQLFFFKMIQKIEWVILFWHFCFPKTLQRPSDSRNGVNWRFCELRQLGHVDEQKYQGWTNQISRNNWYQIIRRTECIKKIFIDVVSYWKIDK